MMAASAIERLLVFKARVRFCVRRVCPRADVVSSAAAADRYGQGRETKQRALTCSLEN